MTAQDVTIRRWEEAAAIARPLTLPEREALRADIAARGVIYPVLVLPDGRIVDGHHRWELSDGSAPITILPAMSDQAALYLAGQLNHARRHLDRAEWKALLDKQEWRAAAIAMLAVTTQKEVAKVFGVSDSTISNWKRAANVDTIPESGIVSVTAGKNDNNDDPEEPARRPYHRVKDHREALTEQERKRMIRLYWSGTPAPDVAKQFNVTERTVRRIANAALQTPKAPAPRPTVVEETEDATDTTPDDEAPRQRVTRSRRIYSFDRPLTAPRGATQSEWTATILGIIEFTKALRDQGVRPLVRQWPPARLAQTLADLDTMIGQIQQLRAEVAAAVLPDDTDP